MIAPFMRHEPDHTVTALYAALSPSIFAPIAEGPPKTLEEAHNVST